jgi:hypothetical protein
LASKSVVTIFSDLASKLLAMVLFGLTLNPMTTVSTGLTSISVVGFLIESQIKGDGGFPGLGLKIDSYGLTIWTLKLL